MGYAEHTPVIGDIGAALEEKEAAAARQPQHVFVIPERYRSLTKCDAIGMAELEVHQELSAAERSKGQTPLAFTYALLQESLRSCLKYDKSDAKGKRFVVTQRLTMQDASTEKWFAECGGHVRKLLLQAYSAVTSTPDEDEEAFLKSRTVMSL